MNHQVPFCKCRKECLSGEVLKPGVNRGRWYWRCATDTCHFFIWDKAKTKVYAEINFNLQKNKRQLGETRNKAEINLNKDFYPFKMTESLVTKRRRRRDNNMIIVNRTEVILTLHSKTDILISATARHQFIQTILQIIPNKVGWNNHLKCWVISADLETYATVWKALYNNKEVFDVVGIPSAILQYLPKTHSILLESLKKDEHEEQIKKLSNPSEQLDWVNDWFQQEVLRESDLWQFFLSPIDRYAVKRTVEICKGRVLLNGGTKTAKIYQSLALASIYQDDWPVLILCNSKECDSWKKNVQFHLNINEQNICIINNTDSSCSNKNDDDENNIQKSNDNRNMKDNISATSNKKNQLMSRLSKLKKNNASPKIQVLEDKLYISLKNDSGDTYPKRKYFPQINQNKSTYSNQTATDEDDDYDDDDDDDNDKNNNDGNGTHSKEKNKNKKNQRNNKTNGDLMDREKGIQKVLSFSKTKVFIVSYEVAQYFFKTIYTNKKFKFIIFDDCEQIKYTLLQKYKTSLTRFIKNSNNTIMINNLSIYNKPIEVYPMLQLLRPELFLDFKFFGKRYCDGKNGVFGWDYTGASNINELEYFLEHTVVISTDNYKKYLDSTEDHFDLSD